MHCIFKFSFGFNHVDVQVFAWSNEQVSVGWRRWWVEWPGERLMWLQDHMDCGRNEVSHVGCEIRLAETLDKNVIPEGKGGTH